MRANERSERPSGPFKTRLSRLETDLLTEALKDPKAYLKYQKKMMKAIEEVKDTGKANPETIEAMKQAEKVRFNGFHKTKEY